MITCLQLAELRFGFAAPEVRLQEDNAAPDGQEAFTRQPAANEALRLHHLPLVARLEHLLTRQEALRAALQMAVTRKT